MENDGAVEMRDSQISFGAVFKSPIF